MPQQLDLCEGNIVVADLGGGCSIASDLHENCPCCGNPDCHFCCDESKAEDSTESEEDAAGRIAWNHYCDGLESLILALACAGFDVTDVKFQEAVQTAINAGANNL
jgi:hypothetical protein